MSDQTPLSEELLIWLSAYVDDELTDEERAKVDELAAKDPRIAVELEALFDLNIELRGAFNSLLKEPVPDVLAQEEPVEVAPPSPELLTPEAATPTMPEPANTNRAPWRSMAAMLALGAILGAGGMFAARTAPEPVQIAASRSWLGEVAEYHQIYARQTRHLVEIPASEQAHIEKWLSKEVGFDFKVPDLIDAGWTFQGGRLLVAAGKPVAQLLYTDASGAVIALCALQNGSGEASGLTPRAFGDVHMATWKSEAGSFAIVGDTPDALDELATLAAPLI